MSSTRRNSTGKSYNEKNSLRCSIQDNPRNSDTSEIQNKNLESSASSLPDDNLNINNQQRVLPVPWSLKLNDWIKENFWEFIIAMIFTVTIPILFSLYISLNREVGISASKIDDVKTEIENSNNKIDNIINKFKDDVKISLELKTQKIENEINILKLSIENEINILKTKLEIIVKKK